MDLLHSLQHASPVVLNGEKWDGAALGACLIQDGSEVQVSLLHHQHQLVTHQLAGRGVNRDSLLH